MLRYLQNVPEGLLGSAAAELYRILDGPTVLHLAGRRSPPIFISVLQHGNEDTGWEAVRRLLCDYRNRELPRSLMLFIANVEAARYGLRRLDHQPDFNRCWPGGPPAGTEVHRALSELMDQVRSSGLHFSLDIHNNSGRNPHYAAINRLDPRWLFMAREFDRQAVYFRHPKGTQSDAFSHFCPAITIECGKAGNRDAVPHCHDYLKRALRWRELPRRLEPDPDFQLFHTVARTTVAAEIEIGFGDQQGDLVLIDDIESFNFRHLSPGTVLGEVRASHPAVIHALTRRGEDVTARYFGLDYGKLVVRRSFVPAMLSTDTRIVRQDCLCYVMEPLKAPRTRDPGQGEGSVVGGR